jgi:hypothetical protein
MSETGDGRFDLDRFLDDLRRTGTVIAGPVAGEPESPWVDPPEEWLVEAHRGQRIEPPYRLRLDERQFAEAVEHDAAVSAAWWPGGDDRARAYKALLLSFDAALVGIDRTPHGFVLEGADRLLLTTHHHCPRPVAHLDPDSGDHTWSADEPGTPEFEAERAEQTRRSRHRRHSYLVLGWLEIEAAYDNGQRMDAAMGLVQDQLGDAFGNQVFQRFSDYLQQNGSPSTVELSEVMHAEDERFDAFLDALAGEPRDG